ncbi:hypothetical protein C0J52_23204 [Blattella germanica]|nr:hypothetical protein C0J52_23204 [Blattella germanica]
MNYLYFSKIVLVSYFRESAMFCLSRPMYIGEHQLFVRRRQMRQGPSRAETVDAMRVDVLDHGRILSVLAACNGNFQEQLCILLREILPPENNTNKIICGHLENTFSSVYQGCKAYPFGSSVTGLAFKGSDLDVYLDIDSSDVNNDTSVNRAKKILSRNNQYFQHVFAIPKAKTPIVKFVHGPTKINCDLSFKNALGVNNSGLIKFYLSMDPRLKPMLLIIKYWARKHDLSGPGKLTNYALSMLAFCYLQQLPQPVIPTVYDLQKTCQEKTFISGWNCSYHGNIAASVLDKNTMSIPRLLYGYFEFWATFDFEKYVVCPLFGGKVEKSAFRKPQSLPQEMNYYKEKAIELATPLRADTFLCIQDPFELTHNLTAGMGAKAVEKFKLYCATAAEICNEALTSETRFLWNLFDESRKPRDILWFGKSTVFKFPVIQNISKNLEEMSDLYLKALLDVCKDVLKVDIEVVDHVLLDNVVQRKLENVDQSVSKIQKLEGQLDVGRMAHEANSNQQEIQSSSQCRLENSEIELWKPKEIHCSGKCRVWVGRKIASQTLTFPDGTTVLERHVMISNYLEQQQQEMQQTASLNFVCLLKLKQNPPQVILELHDKSCSKGDFTHLRTFLLNNLVGLVNKCLKSKYMPKAEEKKPDVCPISVAESV